jgi:DNA phosphorothioation-dependent restriction protein DptH
MNLYIETLTDYLIQQWNLIRTDTNGSQEARFIVESLSAPNTFDLLKALDNQRLKISQQHAMDAHFKVAYGLWQAWQREGSSRESLIERMRTLGAVEPNGNLHWIDEDDRLTFFRNMTKSAEKDSSIAVLIGLGHTSDQGGLSDFHLVDEERIWTELKGSFQPWLIKLCERVGISDYYDHELERFETALHELFTIKPRRLLRLAEYFESQLIQNHPPYESLTEVLVRFYQTLPFWDLPPLNYTPEQVKKLKETKGMIKDANTFISHQKLKSKKEQENFLKKLDKALLDPDFALPTTTNAVDPYADLEDYRSTLIRFAEKGDSQARDLLLNTDQLTLLKIIKTREPIKKIEPEKRSRVEGSSIEAILEAIWNSLRKCAEVLRNDVEADWIECISKIEIQAQQFNHDLEADNESDIAGNVLAREVIRGCLGGLDELLQGMDLRLPWDEEETAIPSAFWQRSIELTFNFEPTSYRFSRKRPHLAFDVIIYLRGPEHSYTSSDVIIYLGGSEHSYTSSFEWVLDATHAERVRFQCAKTILAQWDISQIRTTFLPAFKLDETIMTALYYAADEEEANRLLSNALGMLELIDLMQGLDYNKTQSLSTELNGLVQQLALSYRAWLKTFVEAGYYTANQKHYAALEEAYKALAERVLDKNIVGSVELLRRFYKAFLLLDIQARPNDGFVKSAIVMGISPAIVELSYARETFLRDHFGEIVTQFVRENDLKGKQAQATLTRLFNLVLLQRPLAGLVTDEAANLSAKVKGFNLLHYLGTAPSGAKSLAVQTLLREEDESDEDVSQIRRLSEDGRIIVEVLQTYQRLYPFAADGIRILAVYVDNTPLILSGVDNFLTQYLQDDKGSQQPGFFCELMVYSTSSSPIAIEKKLTVWRDDIAERFREKGRSLQLNVSHRFAPTRKAISDLLSKEQRLYDVAFLFRFLGENMRGQVEAAASFDLHFDNFSKFPISEYPRPIQQGDALKRQSLLSNRRLRIQTLHVDLSARLRHPQDNNKEHLLFGDIDYAPWQDVVEHLHRKAYWVACVDPFIDKRLIGKQGADSTDRKIVGFTSGLGAYGELNRSISTEQDTLGQLAGLVHKELKHLLPSSCVVSTELASQIVNEAEEVIGLAALRAVLGQGEQIREVIGFAAIHRLLAKPPHETMTQLLPLDAFRHWLSESESQNAGSRRADLLQLSLVMRQNEIPLIYATVIECKLAQHSEAHLHNAREQVQESLAHLTQLFAPNRPDIQRVQFDRRYWWAQLQRALTSRSVLALSATEQMNLNAALEKVAEGEYEMVWQGAMFTFWTDITQDQPMLQPYPLDKHILRAPFSMPQDFHLNHWMLGYDGLLNLFNYNNATVELEGAGILIRPDFPPHVQFTQPSPKPFVPHSELPNPAVTDIQPISPESTKPTTHSETNTADHTQANVTLTIESHSNAAQSDSTNNQPNPLTVPASIPETATDSATNTASNSSTATSTEAYVNQSDPTIMPSPSPTPELVPTPPPTITPTPTKASIPERILLGTKANGEPSYWHYGHPQLSNRHMIVFGVAGSGKTYGIQCLLAEMAAQQLNSLIIDYTDGFLPNQAEQAFNEIAKPKNHYVYSEKLPLNPFQRQSQVIDPSLPAFQERPFDVASRITSIFNSVYESMGDQQSSTLTRVIESAISNHEHITLDDLLPLLRDEGNSGVTLANKLEPFVKAQLFSQDPNPTAAWSSLLNKPEHWVNIMQLKGLSRDIYRLATEFLLWDLYNYAVSTGSKYRPIPVVLDEIQNLDHRSDSPIEKMLREGRKFGLSMILATQTASNFDREEKDRLFQADHKLFFKPADTEISSFAEILSVTSKDVSKAEWAERLSKLAKGQCYSLGRVMTSTGELRVKAELVTITSLEARNLVS